MYSHAMLNDLEFWTLKQGRDGLTRVSGRVSGQGQRESWVTSTEDAEADVLKRWATEHMEQLGFMPSWARAWL
jgi:hypothetical protein